MGDRIRKKKDVISVLAVFEFLVLDVFIQKSVDRFDGKAGGDLSEGIDLHFEAFQFLMYTRLLFFFLLFGHLSLRLLAYLTQIEFFWPPLVYPKSQKLPSGQDQHPDQ